MERNASPAAPGHIPYKVPGLESATSWQEELFFNAITNNKDEMEEKPKSGS